MLSTVSSLTGYAIEATDGTLGTVSDFLFDDQSWKVRWLVVDTGTWLPGRKVLIHVSALGKADPLRQQLPVALTKQQVEDSPDILEHQPVSRRMQGQLYDYYGWDPYWGGNFLGMGSIAGAVGDPAYGIPGAAVAEMAQGNDHEADPHLHSVDAVTGYHIHATDGSIGHVEGFLIEDENWTVGYLIVDTRNWLPGKHVLLSPYAVREIDWLDRQVKVDIPREKIKAGPPWDPVDLIDEAYARRLHSHYDWPDYTI
ncbi:MAG TPA: PRC-barrel domain-containing protein [Stellaceae bacterium]|nr:PRC-barrel domain-containing protein [Stellaceae bacterium]